MKVGYRRICEVTGAHRSDKTGSSWSSVLSAFLSQPGLEFRYSCIQQLGDEMGATGISGAVSSEAETPGSEKKVRFGQSVQGWALLKAPMSWLGTGHTGPHFVWEAPSHHNEDAQARVDSGKPHGSVPSWLWHLLSIQCPRGPLAPIPVSGIPHGLAPSLQVPAADGWWPPSAGPEPQQRARLRHWSPSQGPHLELCPGWSPPAVSA